MSDPLKILRPVDGAWSATAKKLDSYRWKQLRLRHGHFGSAMRFSRDAILDFFYGLRTIHAIKQSAPGAEPCDFLLLQGAPKVIHLQRKKKLIDRLRDNGHHLIETAQEDPADVLKKKRLARPPQKLPLRYLCYAAYAQWLVCHYTPKVLINDRNGSLLSPFLRLSLHHQDSPLVHLAHATTVESSRLLGMTDYDYYFLFGQSSLNALRQRPLRFGTTSAVLSGSHMIDDSFNLSKSASEKRNLLILGVGPDKEKESGYEQTYMLLAQWSENHPEFQVIFKPHPRSKSIFWKDMAKHCRTIEVLKNNCSLAKALSHSSLVVNIMSNAVIEAALAQRPIIYVNAGTDQDIFEQEKFFGTKVETLQDLEQRINNIYLDYSQAMIAAEKFAAHHLNYGSEGLKKTVEFLESLKNRRDVPHETLKELL